MMAQPAREIDRYLRSKGSPLAGLGSTFVRAGKRYGIDPRILVAISGAETSFGTTGNASSIYNAWGWGPGIKFGSWREAINTVAKGLKTGYYDQGLTTIPAIQKKWAPDRAANDPTGLNSNWTKNVTNFYREIGGVSDSPTPGIPSPSAPNGGGRGSPFTPQGGINTPPAAPDTKSVALAGLQHLATGDYDPQKGLADLLAAESAATATLSKFASSSPPAGLPDIQIEAGASTRDKRAVSLIKEYLGTPYHWGGSSPSGFDCSGLLQFVWSRQGVSIPRTTYEQWKAGKKVSGPLRAGDAVFFNMGKGGPGHVGMYIGGGKMIVAPHSGAVVRVESLKGRKDYAGARRFA